MATRLLGTHLYVRFWTVDAAAREVIAAAQIIYSVLVLCFVSSKDELDVIGVTISPSVEVLLASLSIERHIFQ